MEEFLQENPNLINDKNILLEKLREDFKEKRIEDNGKLMFIFEDVAGGKVAEIDLISDNIKLYNNNNDILYNVDYKENKLIKYEKTSYDTANRKIGTFIIKKVDNLKINKLLNSNDNIISETTFKNDKIIKKIENEYNDEGHKLIGCTEHEYDDEENIITSKVVENGTFLEHIETEKQVDGSLTLQNTFDRLNNNKVIRSIFKMSDDQGTFITEETICTKEGGLITKIIEDCPSSGKKNIKNSYNNQLNLEETYKNNKLETQSNYSYSYTIDKDNKKETIVKKEEITFDTLLNKPKKIDYYTNDKHESTEEYEKGILKYKHHRNDYSNITKTEAFLQNKEGESILNYIGYYINDDVIVRNAQTGNFVITKYNLNSLTGIEYVKFISKEEAENKNILDSEGNITNQDGFLELLDNRTESKEKQEAKAKEEMNNILMQRIKLGTEVTANIEGLSRIEITNPLIYLNTQEEEEEYIYVCNANNIENATIDIIRNYMRDSKIEYKIMPLFTEGHAVTSIIPLDPKKQILILDSSNAAGKFLLPPIGREKEFGKEYVGLSLDVQKCSITINQKFQNNGTCAYLSFFTTRYLETFKPEEMIGLINFYSKEEVKIVSQKLTIKEKERQEIDLTDEEKEFKEKQGLKLTEEEENLHKKCEEKSKEIEEGVRLEILKFISKNREKILEKLNERLESSKKLKNFNKEKENLEEEQVIENQIGENDNLSAEIANIRKEIEELKNDKKTLDFMELSLNLLTADKETNAAIAKKFLNGISV